MQKSFFFKFNNLVTGNTKQVGGETSFAVKSSYHLPTAKLNSSTLYDLPHQSYERFAATVPCNCGCNQGLVADSSTNLQRISETAFTLIDLIYYLVFRHLCFVNSYLHITKYHIYSLQITLPTRAVQISNFKEIICHSKRIRYDY